MRSNEDFIIPFEGLKPGKHAYEFQITDAFFAALDYALIDRGTIDVGFVLDKRENMMVGDFSFSGHIVSQCDRCDDELIIPIVSTHQIVFKFDNTPSEDENLICISESEFTIDIAPLCYELITIALPMRKVHKEGECNPDYLNWEGGFFEEELEEEALEEENETDPRWEALKNLKDKLD